ncbi:hypothetical protein BU23DRAFT_560211 [Bimuria novae-zelandiae CBS 107.79]|uniref:Uncharacterized protein n=1 Tax=Bimuria novae-zelandiae CBS 107.79 TaxID=1447943 RepID=A0A6A5UN96_9PLEO|nr:hypothetical protein BU23DRAFT_560211 [Bimuria novae-zelandiae CBS 107.79]
MSKPLHTLSSLLETLLPVSHLTRPPAHTTDPSLTPVISSLLLHPTIEATLHLLNADLPSAHFLVRHMLAPPAIEGMLLHSILHRCEGDMRNARLWASDVLDANGGWVPKHKGAEQLGADVMDEMKGNVEGDFRVVEFFYGEDNAKMERLIDDVEKWRKGNEIEVEAELGGG